MRIAVVVAGLMAVFVAVVAAIGTSGPPAEQVEWRDLGTPEPPAGPALASSDRLALEPETEPPLGLARILAASEVPRYASLFGQPVPLDRDEVREAVAYEILITLARPAMPLLWMRRAPELLPEIRQTLAEAGVPEDLAYLAVIESDLLLEATSPAGARGPWQFIRGTARRYGLRVDRTVDERLDPRASTRAAIAYLSDLYAEFGDWFLAAAAYNAGEKRVREEIAIAGTDDYFELFLPRETRRYVPRILAAKLILENPEAYGLVTLEPLFRPRYKIVELEVPRGRADLAKVAREHGVGYAALRRANPHIRSQALPRGRYRLRVPIPASDAVARRHD